MLSFAVLAPGQWQKKPYREWSEKEARGILDNSPWAQTQTSTDTSHMFDTGRAVVSNERREAEVPETKFHIRFFSSKPVRQATCRMIEIQRKGEISKQLAAQLEGLAMLTSPTTSLLRSSWKWRNQAVRWGAQLRCLIVRQRAN
jgi:hypothetical protein